MYYLFYILVLTLFILMTSSCYFSKTSLSQQQKNTSFIFSNFSTEQNTKLLFLFSKPFYILKLSFCDPWKLLWRRQRQQFFFVVKSSKKKFGREKPLGRRSSVLYYRMYQVSKSDSFFFVCFVYKVNDTLDRETPLLNDSQREESYMCLR